MESRRSVFGLRRFFLSKPVRPQSRFPFSAHGIPPPPPLSYMRVICFMLVYGKHSCAYGPRLAVSKRDRRKVAHAALLRRIKGGPVQLNIHRGRMNEIHRKAHISALFSAGAARRGDACKGIRGGPRSVTAQFLKTPLCVSTPARAWAYRKAAQHLLLRECSDNLADAGYAPAWYDNALVVNALVAAPANA